jgi:shikimate dehydrogenase
MTMFAEVIGDPIAHSKSPLIHGHWLAILGLDAQYSAHHVVADDLAPYVSDRTSDPEWRGCNVTLPHKISVMSLVADPGNVAQSIGAMNTIFRQTDGSLAGTNTDSAGFAEPIADQDWAGAHAIVVGSGGAANAVLFALKQLGFARVDMIARNPLKAMALLSRFGLKGDVSGMESALRGADLLVNASSLGMKGQPDYAPDLSGLPDHTIVYDLVYAPLETALLAAADAQGLRFLNGLDMLVGQAAMAFELFFGVVPPRDQDDALFAKLEAG